MTIFSESGLFNQDLLSVIFLFLTTKDIIPSIIRSNSYFYNFLKHNPYSKNTIKRIISYDFGKAINEIKTPQNSLQIIQLFYTNLNAIKSNDSEFFMWLCKASNSDGLIHWINRLQPIKTDSDTISELFYNTIVSQPKDTRKHINFIILYINTNDSSLFELQSMLSILHKPLLSWYDTVKSVNYILNNKNVIAKASDLYTKEDWPEFCIFAESFLGVIFSRFKYCDKNNLDISSRDMEYIFQYISVFIKWITYFGETIHTFGYQIDDFWKEFHPNGKFAHSLEQKWIDVYITLMTS